MAAKGRIEQEIALTVTGTKDVKDAAKLVDQFDGTKAEVTIDVDDKASKDIKSIDELVEGLTEKQRTIVLKAQADQAERDIKKLTGQLGRAKDAETIQVKVDLLDNASDRLAEINSQLEKLDGQTVDIDTRTAVTGVDDLGRSADSSKSVLANMVGNATQDLGALGGVAGSAGVAIGQMGEYMADARASGEGFGSILKNFSGVALPLAGLSIGVAVISDIIKKAGEMGRKVQEASKIAVSSMLDVAEAGKTLGEGLDDVAETAVEKIFEELGANAPGVVDALERMGITWDEVVEGFRTGKGELADVLGQYEQFLLGKSLYGERQARQSFAERMGLGPAEADALLGRLKIISDTFKTSFEVEAKASEAARAAGAYRADSADAAAAAAETTVAADEEAAAAAAAHTGVLAEQEQQVLDLVQAMEDYAVSALDADNELLKMVGAFDQLGGKQDALSSLFDLGNAPLEALGKVQDIEQGIRDFADFVKDPDGLKGAIPDIFNPDDVNADDFLAQIAGLRDPIQQAVTDAFAAGGPDAAKATADTYVQSIVDALGGKLDKGQVESLLGLTDLDATIAVAVTQSEIDKARRQLEVLTGIGGETPYTASIVLALDAGEITGEQAQALIQPKLEEAGVTIPTGLKVPSDTEIVDVGKAAQRVIDRMPPLNIPVSIGGGKYRTAGGTIIYDQGGTVGPVGGIAGERGPEILNDRYLTTGPTYVPPGTKVTSRKRTAVIINRHGTHGLRRYDRGGVVPAGPVTNINNVKVNLPAGANGADVVRQVKRWQRRNGSLV